MGKRKLRFDARKNYERKKQCTDNTSNSTSSSSMQTSSELAITNECNVHGMYSSSHDKLPPGWASTCITSVTNEDSLALYKLQLQQPLACVNIAYMVTVSPDCTWTLCVSNKIIDTRGCSRLNSFAEMINNVDELIQLLSVIDGSKHCAGNPDEKFYDLITSHKGTFKNQQGYFTHSYIATYIIYIYIYTCIYIYMHIYIYIYIYLFIYLFIYAGNTIAYHDTASSPPTIRCNDCEILINPSVTSGRCQRCNKYR